MTEEEEVPIWTDGYLRGQEDMRPFIDGLLDWINNLLWRVEWMEAQQKGNEDRFTR